MKNRAILEIPYGSSSLKVAFDKDRLLGVLQNSPGRKEDIARLLSKSLENPLGRKELNLITKGKKKVLIVVPDATRNAHLKDILPALLERLRKTADSISVIIATGLHKEHTPSEITALLGEDVIKSCRIIRHRQSGEDLADLGRTGSKRVPIVLNKALKEHDFIVTIGVIEPHLYAGYSGGFKTIAIGLAGEETINATHGVEFLDDPGTALGSVSGNPFQATLAEIAGKVSIDFSVNVVNHPDGEAVAVFSGDTREVFRAGVKFAKNIFEVKAKRSSDIVICGIGYPKDMNLYQASRAMNYVMNVGTPVLKRGGLLIIAAELRHGVGTSASEKRFYDELKKMASPDEFISEVRRSGCITGVHRAYMVARALKGCRAAFVTERYKEFEGLTPLKFFRGMDEAIGYADNLYGEDSTIYVIPHALSTIADIE